MWLQLKFSRQEKHGTSEKVLMIIHQMKNNYKNREYLVENFC